MSVNAVVHIKTKLPGAKMAISEDPFFRVFFRNPQFEQKNPPMQEGSGSVLLSPMMDILLPITTLLTNHRM